MTSSEYEKLIADRRRSECCRLLRGAVDSIIDDLRKLVNRKVQVEAALDALKLDRAGVVIWANEDGVCVVGSPAQVETYRRADARIRKQLGRKWHGRIIYRERR